MADQSVLGRATAPDVINLGKGHPHRSLLDLESVCAAFSRAVQRPDAAMNMMQYGPGEGNADMLKSIRQCFHPNAPSGSLLVTNGSGQALDLVCCLFSQPGDVIFVDSPSYFLAFFTFKDHRLVVRDVPTGKHGMDLDALEVTLKETTPDKRPKLLYTVPVGNNPNGTSMTVPQMQRLVALSRDYGFKIIADEVYRFLTFPETEPTLPSLFEFDDPANPTVFSLNSFSKLLGPGVRLGWIHTAPSHVEKMCSGGLLLSGGGLNPFTSEIVNEMLEGGEQLRIIAHLRKTYTSNVAVMCDALDKHVLPLKPGITYNRPTGGFFLWLEFPPNSIDTWELNELAQTKFGVSFFPGAKFSSTGRGTRLDSALRICFAYLDQAQIVEGVQRLSLAVKEAYSLV
ncbi:2-aminoadipate transaminase [Porphyridium purpureum]|uniref:2-aminoadipate transaminase n=1 Tax=Porphyridium purpureum TaxID=35688 RepID=A0A5J4YPK7_PORPP|nr:2-aminoadipate transaminase [Porphyridium purpureum]|eukprot:POR0065..scf222_8